jgi:hypothetical protein
VYVVERRDVTLYGWVRGTYLKSSTKVHVPGCGDFGLEELTALGDPCPLPSQERKRTLNEKDKLLYAPMSDIGNVAYDNDVVYINLHHPSAAAALEAAKQRAADGDEEAVLGEGAFFLQLNKRPPTVLSAFISRLVCVCAMNGCANLLTALVFTLSLSTAQAT